MPYGDARPRVREVQLDNTLRACLALPGFMALPPSDLPTLASWDAIETRNRIRKKDVSALEVLEAAIARAEEDRASGPCFERTYERARARAANGDSEAPLSGVPTFIKDLAQIRDVATTWGSQAAGPPPSRVGPIRS